MNTTFTDSIALFQVAASNDKAKPEYGKSIAKSLLNDFGGQNGYIQRRNVKIEQNDTFAKGNQDMTEFLDLIGIDGKNAYVNLDLRPLKVVPKFIRNITQRFMERDERPSVDAVDLATQKEKQKQKDEAEFRMRKMAEIQELQAGSGLQLEDESAYTPVDEDDLEFYFEEEWQDYTSVRFQEHIYSVLMDNAYPEFKRKAIRNVVKHGFFACRVYRGGDSRTKLRLCKNQNMVYGYSDRDDFGDCLVFGERRKYKVSQFRVAFPDIDEQKVFEFYKKSNKSVVTSWDEKYRTAMYRDYDDYTIDVMEFEVITSEDEAFLYRKTRSGKQLVFRPENAENYSGEKSVLKRKREVVYAGVYVESADEIVKWELQSNMIVPHWNMGEVMSSYVVIMPDNDDMEPEPLLDGVVTPIRMMCITHMKLMQLIGKMRPDGLFIDVDGLDDIDLGNGNMSPLQLQAVYDQTGVLYYRSSGDNPDERKAPPIQGHNSNNKTVQDIQSLITAYNFYQSQLRDVLGVNEYTEGQGVNPKLGLGVMQNQVNASNRNTEFIYDAFIKGLDGVAKRIAVLEWYKIVNDPAYSKLSKDEVFNKKFDLNISLLPTEQERQYLESLVNNALGAGLITFEEAFKIRNIAAKNVKHAEKYLGIYERKRKAQAMVETQQNAQLNAQAQQASNAQAHELAMQLEQVKGSMKVQTQDSMNKGEEMKDFAKFVREMMLEAFKQGRELPQNLQGIADQYLQGAMAQNQLGMIGKQMEANAIQQQMAQAAQEQQQQQSMQEQGQDFQ